jgi:hypothetical protein
MPTGPDGDPSEIGSGGGRGRRPDAGRPLGSELPLKQHQGPDPGAVGAEVRLDLGGQLANSGQVDAEQLRAPLQRRRHRPAAPAATGRFTRLTPTVLDMFVRYYAPAPGVPKEGEPDDRLPHPGRPAPSD